MCVCPLEWRRSECCGPAGTFDSERPSLRLASSALRPSGTPHSSEARRPVRPRPTLTAFTWNRELDYPDFWHYRDPEQLVQHYRVCNYAHLQCSGQIFSSVLLVWNVSVNLCVVFPIVCFWVWFEPDFVSYGIVYLGKCLFLVFIIWMYECDCFRERIVQLKNVYLSTVL